MAREHYEWDDLFLLRLKSGDETAYEKVFRENYNRIAGFCNQFVNDPDKARSLAQDVFLNLWLHREKIGSLNGIKSFLFTYAKSGCLNYLRHRRVEEKYAGDLLRHKEEELNREILESFDFQSFEFKELEDLIREAIDDLPEQCRRVFIMSRFEGKKNLEISTELQITVKAVEANMTRALKSMRSRLSQILPGLLVQLIMHHLS